MQHPAMFVLPASLGIVLTDGGMGAFDKPVHFLATLAIAGGFYVCGLLENIFKED